MSEATPAQAGGSAREPLRLASGGSRCSDQLQMRSQMRRGRNSPAAS